MNFLAQGRLYYSTAIETLRFSELKDEFYTTTKSAATVTLHFSDFKDEGAKYS